MPWILLFVAGLFEVAWAYYMKQSSGFTRLWPSVITITTMIISFLLLSLAMRTLPLGTAYTVWTGVGAIGAFTVGVAVLGEPADAMAGRQDALGRPVEVEQLGGFGEEPLPGESELDRHALSREQQPLEVGEERAVRRFGAGREDIDEFPAEAGDEVEDGDAKLHL